MKRFFQDRRVLIGRILFAACLLGSAAELIVWVSRLTKLPTAYDINQVIAWGAALPIVFSFLGMLIITHQPGNRIGWFMMLIAVFSLNPASFFANSLSTPPEHLTPVLWLVLWTDAWSWVPVIFPIFLIPLHFPTGQPPSPRWNWVNRLALGMWLFFMVFVAFGDKIGPLNGNWEIPNPVGFYSFEQVNTPFQVIWTAGLFTLLLAGVVSLFVRYRRSSENIRLQIKWLLYSGAFFAVIYIISAMTIDLPSMGVINNLFVLSILAIPTAIAIAILRYRLYDIDLIIRRTLVYSLLTGMLSLVYFGGVALSQNFLTGDHGQLPPFVIVLTTLAIATLFNPLRRRLQETIDQRFYRQKYDLEKALAEFATSARTSTDLSELSSDLVGVVSKTLQPNYINLWMKQIIAHTYQEKK
jgi:hypothetical protein